MKGFMGKILRVDLTTGEIRDEIIAEEVYEKFMGGVGLGAYIIYRDIPAGADPLGPDNVLGFTPGLLTGTSSFMMGRFMAHCKSPLTGGIGDANCGGQFAPEIKKCGYDGIFVTGISDKPVYLYVTNKGAELKDASHVWGKDAVEAEEVLMKDHTTRKKPRVALIGQSGEKVSLISGIVNDGGRIAARSGVGAVMGSKRLKALVLNGTKKVQVADHDAIREENKKFADVVRAQNIPGLVNTGALKMLGHMVGRNHMEQVNDGSANYGVLKRFGTQAGTQMLAIAGDAPIMNWAGGSGEFPASMSDKVSNKGLKMDQREMYKYHCAQCAIGCGGICKIDDIDRAKGKFTHTHKPEYETTGVMGGMLLNTDGESLFYINELLNRAGMDTISAGGTMAFAIECYENGLLTKEDTAGLDLKWGNSEAIMTLFEQMVDRSTWLGDVLANGSKKAAEIIGKGAEAYAITAGGQEPGMHDPRFNVGFGVDYSFNPTPGKHTSGAAEYNGTFLWDYVSFAPEPEKEHKDETTKPNPLFAQKAVLATWHKLLIDVAGGCIMGFGGGVKVLNYFKLFNSATGWNRTPDDYMLVGSRINTIRQLFNFKHGINPKDYFMHTRIETPRPSGYNKGRGVQMAPIVALCWEKSGWDTKTGYPTEDTLRNLELDTLLELEPDKMIEMEVC